jgi:hypothetical protein
MIYFILYMLLAGVVFIYKSRIGLSQAFHHYSAPFNYIIVGSAMIGFVAFAGLILPFVWVVPLSDYLGKPI